MQAWRGWAGLLGPFVAGLAISTPFVQGYVTVANIKNATQNAPNYAAMSIADLKVRGLCAVLCCGAILVYSALGFLAHW